MKTKIDRTLIITTILCLLPIILGVFIYNRLPEEIAIHFNNNGVPDNYLPKVLVVFALPAGLALINLYSHFRLNNDPKSENASFTLKKAAKWLTPLISLIAMPITLFMAMGTQIPIVMIIEAVVGGVIVVCGNYLPKCKRNYTVGIRLPWTLDSEDNWNRTHRFAGFIWVLGGLAFAANAFISLKYAVFVIIVLLVLLPPIYSYLLYRKQL